MDTIGEPPAKKRRLELAMDTSAPIYEPPEIHSIIGLYNPEMIRATLSDQCIPNPRKITFKVPKALICSRSEYFAGVFQDAFVGKKGRCS